MDVVGVDGEFRRPGLARLDDLNVAVKETTGAGDRENIADQPAFQLLALHPHQLLDGRVHLNDAEVYDAVLPVSHRLHQIKAVEAGLDGSPETPVTGLDFSIVVCGNGLQFLAAHAFQTVMGFLQPLVGQKQFPGFCDEVLFDAPGTKLQFFGGAGLSFAFQFQPHQLRHILDAVNDPGHLPMLIEDGNVQGAPIALFKAAAC